MPVEIKSLSGKLNMDSSLMKLPSGDHTQALNITRNNSNIAHNIVGNQLVVNPFLHDTGVNKRIGHKEDVTRNRIYEFICNSDGYHIITYYDAGTNTINRVVRNLIDTANIDILEFDFSFRINHIDIIYREGDEGDLLTFCAQNSTPKCLNVKRVLTGEYNYINKAFIEMAKKPFLSPIKVEYGSDVNRNANSIKRNLFQFSYRPVFDDYQKGTPATFSKIALPIGFYGSDNDIDPTKNNFITLTLETGDEDVFQIEILMRYNLGNVWSDFVQVAILNKTQLGIGDNTITQYLFYNDGVYPPVPLLDAIQLYDYVPQIAGTQALANGNVPVYADIIEGYNNYPISQLNVTITSENKTNIPPDTDPPSITYVDLGNGLFSYTVAGGVPVGTSYKIYTNIPPNPGPLVGNHVLTSSYTAILGDSLSDVVTGLFNSTSAFYRDTITGNSFAVGFPNGSMVAEITVIPGTIPGDSISTEKTWLWYCNYIFGIVYVDEQNRDMPGVTTYSSPVSTDNDFVVTTPPFETDGADVKTPVITATINHAPPERAVKYYWARRRQTIGTFLMYVTCDMQEDDNYYYFCLANITEFKLENSLFNYGEAPVTPNSRIKVIAQIETDAYNGTTWTQDYQILGTLTKTLTGGTSPVDDKTFIKVKKPIAPVSPVYTANMMAIVYEPAEVPLTEGDCVYWEWGEAYDVYTLYVFVYSGLTGVFNTGDEVAQANTGATGIVIQDNGTDEVKIQVTYGRFNINDQLVGTSGQATITSQTIERYHRGKDQDQTESQEAIFVWPEGDVYFHQRALFDYLVGTHTAEFLLNIMDENYSDYFPSKVNDNGRPQAIEVNAKKQRNIAESRFGGAFQDGTNINEINRFRFENFDVYSRDNGIIRKLFVEGRRLFVFQQFDVGVVPILTQIIKDTSGNPLEANSDILLNKIAYPFIGKHGIGDTPESFSYSNGAKYFTDSNLGVAIRLAGDGVTELSVIYQMNNFFISKLAPFGKDLDNGIVPDGEVYKGTPTVYGAFDNEGNRYVISFEEINRYSNPETLVFHQAAITLSFYEIRNSMEGFESEFSFKSEGVGCLNNLIVSWVNGALWIHNNPVFNNFYGVQYPSSITPVFNDKAIIKKKQLAIGYISDNDKVWSCPEISTNLRNPQTGLIQQSVLIEKDFKLEETVLTAGLLRDKNSMTNPTKALLEGAYLGGNYISIKFEMSPENSANLVSLIDPYLTDIASQKNL